MNERKVNWWQVIIQLLPSIVPTSLAVLVGVFRDVFPSWAFLSLIIILTFFLVIALFRLVLGDVLTKFSRKLSTYKGKCHARKLVLSWKQKWDALSQLVSQCIDQKEPPTPQQEKVFQQLHHWFIINRSNFLPLWHNFSVSRTKADHESWDSYDPRKKMLHEHWKDPFSVIYKAPSLKEAILSWGILDNGPDHWLNKYQDKSPFKHALNIVAENLEELAASI